MTAKETLRYLELLPLFTRTRMFEAGWAIISVFFKRALRTNCISYNC